MKKNLKAGDVCPHCKVGTLALVKSIEPYNEDHLQCNNCDSTYLLTRVIPMTDETRKRLREVAESLKGKELFPESNARAREIISRNKDWTFLNKRNEP